VKRISRQPDRALQRVPGQRLEPRSSTSMSPCRFAPGSDNCNESVSLWVEPNRGLSSSGRHFGGVLSGRGQG
jgi:hypothetical protein